jgi:hypothetical protein
MTWYYIQKDRTLHNHWSENLKPSKDIFYYVLSSISCKFMFFLKQQTVSQPYETKGKITVLCVLTFTVMENRLDYNSTWSGTQALPVYILVQIPYHNIQFMIL